MTGAAVVEAVSGNDREACLAIRVDVFCLEQGVSRELELDGLDGICRHYLARDGGTAVGTARTRPLGDGVVKCERMAVLAPFRGRGIGRAMLERALRDARRGGHATALLHAQTRAAPFYERMGFGREGDVFEEAGIAHVRMTLAL